MARATATAGVCGAPAPTSVSARERAVQASPALCNRPIRAGPTASQPWMAIFGAVVSVLSLVGVVWWALGQEPPTLPDTAAGLGRARGRHRARTASPRASAGERWQALLRHNGAHPHRADSYSLTAVGYMGNNVLPARAGDAFRVVLMAPRAETGARTVIGTLARRAPARHRGARHARSSC